MIDEGWIVELDDPPKCFTLTEKGEDYLKKARWVLEPFHKDLIDEFCKND